MTITIIGIGLIGGSLAISLKENGFANRIIGVDKSQDNLDKAIRRRIIDEDADFKTGVEAANIILVATPMDAMPDVISAVLDLIRPDQVVLEVGSTKRNLLDQLKKHPNRKRLVATHPMAGTENSGPEAAIPNLFDEKYTVIINPNESDADAVELIEGMYQSIPMKITHMQAEEHDTHTAYVSHISHITSFALALTVLEKEKDEDQILTLASSGFASTVRLAKSSPDMWVPIFRQNRDNVLDVLDEHINQLARFRSLLIKNDFDAFYELITESNKIRKILS